VDSLSGFLVVSFWINVLDSGVPGKCDNASQNANSKKDEGMTLRRVILGALTLIVVLIMGESLISSWNAPQVTNQLQLYQTDLLLHTSELQLPTSGKELPPVRNVILDLDPMGSALKQYQTVQQEAEATLDRFQTRLAQLPPEPVAPTAGASPRRARMTPTQTLQVAIQQQQALLAQLQLRQGIIRAEQDHTAEAIAQWQALIAEADRPGGRSDAAIATTAQVLVGLWSTPPQILPNAEGVLQKNLTGWFRYVGLKRLYTLQQRSETLAVLEAQEQAIAQQTVVKLALVGSIPVLACLVGVAIALGLIVQRVLKGKDAILAQNGSLAWEVPWNWEIVWQVLIVGFFIVGQLLLPLILGGLGASFARFGTQARAFYTLTYYLSLTSLGLLVLYLSIKPFFPLPPQWFQFRLRDNWLGWGLGGYLVVLPLMIGVSWVNQQIWQGQGGSNPLLQIVLEERDPVALGIFFFTAVIAAPFFEETIFRGFLLSSLTRYFPVWGAIGGSALLFAIAHLSLSEVLPLTVLGMALGFVYTRTRNLLAPMLLHGLWNSATLISLFLLGSGAR
jgi:membrane protease YdiL (CAAX protease family)